MSDPLSWEDQRAFLAIFDGGSLSAAARTLGVTQPTVRARLEALELGIGTVLFTRSSQGLVPTGHARALYAHARAMDHASRAFLRAASATSGEVEGVVRLSVADMVGLEVLPTILTGLRAQHPKLVIEIELSNAQADIGNQAADVAVRMDMPAHDTLIARKVGEITLGLYAHRDYVAQRGNPASLDELDTHDLVGPDRSVADHRFAQAVLPPAACARFMIRTDSHPAQLAAARAGLGIAVVQTPLGAADPYLVRVVPHFVAASLPVWLVAHRDMRHEPRIRVTLDHLAGALELYCR